MKYYLAVDIGASGGRHILGSLHEGKMVLEEIYRFPNGMQPKEGALCWDLVQLFEEIKTGMKKCAQAGKIPVSVGIDTWGVDFVLLDQENRIIGQTVGYRDARTQGMDEAVEEVLGEQELYERTGIRKQSFNTVYQLMSVKKRQPEQLEQAESLLLLPDYFHFLLTGIKKSEYTESSTSGLISAETGDWDRELLKKLGFPERIFQEVVPAGTVLGGLRGEIIREVGFDCRVVLPASHDTGSAVLAVPAAEKELLYISSGTWSLMGTLREQADCREECRRRGFTNEGGYGRQFRFLKNIMGLWMIQSVRKECAAELSFGELCKLAEGEQIASCVDCNDSRFMAPESMAEAVRGYCFETGQEVPQSAAQLAAVIYGSLAKCYAVTAEEIEGLTGVYYPAVYIVGGGSNADYLNQLTANYTKKVIYAGPGEASSAGNLAVQMLSDGDFTDIRQARGCIAESFPIRRFVPENSEGTGTNEAAEGL